VNINAYHQPGVEAGKKAATRVLELQKRVKEIVAAGADKTPEEIARELEADPEDVFHIVRHLTANE
jgi:glucose-6-phosphate isomerase